MIKYIHIIQWVQIVLIRFRREVLSTANMGRQKRGGGNISLRCWDMTQQAVRSSYCKIYRCTICSRNRGKTLSSTDLSFGGCIREPQVAVYHIFIGNIYMYMSEERCEGRYDFITSQMRYKVDVRSNEVMTYTE